MQTPTKVLFAAIVIILSSHIALGQYTWTQYGTGQYTCGGIAGISCPSGYTCKIDEPIYPDKMGWCTKSTINQVCSANIDRVCGMDGVTYSNSCQAGLAGAKVACKGACPCSSGSCISLWNPVCGTDGKTYGNACEANMAKAKIACSKACPCTPCPSKPTPKCNPWELLVTIKEANGCSSYQCEANACPLSMIAPCRIGEIMEENRDSRGCPTYKCKPKTCLLSYITTCKPWERLVADTWLDGCPRYRCVMQTGTCKNRCGSMAGYLGQCACDSSCSSRGNCCADYKTYCSIKCASIVDPVCSTNGVNYTNKCEAGRAGAIVACKGYCPCNATKCPLYPMPYCPEGKVAQGAKGADGCYGPLICVNNTICPSDYKPVCSSVGKTYSNACLAEKWGAVVVCNGECPCSSQNCPTYVMPYCPGGTIVAGAKDSNGCPGPARCVSKSCPTYTPPYCPNGQITPGVARADGCIGPATCSVKTTGSCHDSCGGISRTGTCHCDPVCANFNDCCSDYKIEC